jgi:membrane-bound serine protease (ClpP class)
MLKGIPLLLSFLMLLAAVTTARVGAAAPQVAVLEVKGTVNPPLADYIERGISQAEKDGAVACIIELDTPGGLLSSTEDIVSRISKATVPIVVYVPRGGWAASAGAFITLAADVAAMGPESVIGASTPIAGGGGELSEDERNKAINLARQWMKSIAEEHGRNEEAAMAAVTEAASFSPGEARGIADLSAENQEILGVERLDPPLIDDAGATDVEELIGRLGEGITLANGEPFSIPSDVSTKYIKMTAIEHFLLAISDPNIAYILLSIAMLGIIIELAHPGIILPGVVGGVCLLLSVYSLDILGANYTGILLMVLAFGLFIAEVFTATFGLLFAGGVVSLILGSLILFSGTSLEIDPKVIATVIVFFVAIFAFIVAAIIRAHRRRITTGREGLVGQTAVAKTALDPNGTVFIEGERWNATADSGRIEAGEEVIVTKVEGLKLKVARKSK